MLRLFVCFLRDFGRLLIFGILVLTERLGNKTSFGIYTTMGYTFLELRGIFGVFGIREPGQRGVYIFIHISVAR